MAVALSVAARFWLLGRRPLWHDEVFTIWISRFSPAEIVRVLRRDSGPPLFYLLEKPLVALLERFRLPDRTARLLPFLAIALLFAASAALPRRARPRFLWLAACSPLLLLYSTEARAYAVVGLLGLLLFRLAVRDAPSAATLAAIVATAGAIVWMHYIGLFVVASLAAASMAAGRPRPAAALAAGLVSFLPWASILAAQPPDATGWIRDNARVSVAGFLGALGGGARVLPPFGRPLPANLSWLAAAAGAVLLAFLALRRRADPETRIGLATVLLTLAGLLVVSLRREIAIAGRSEVAVLPIWIFLAAREGESSRAIRWAAAAVTAIGLLSSGWVLRSPRSTRPFAEIPTRLTGSARPGDLLIASGNFYLPARLARDRGILAAGLEGLPTDLQDHPGWLRGEPAAESDYRRIAQEFAAAGSDRSVFLLLDPLYWTPRMRQIVASRGSPTVERLPRYGFLVVSPPRRGGGTD